MHCKVFFTVIIFLLVVSAGCSGGTGINPASPDAQTHAVDGYASGMLPVGLWQFAADPYTGTLDIVQLRSAELSLNVLPFMEPPPLLNLTIDWDTLDIDGENSYIGVDVILKHPFVTPNGDFPGFDVRGVVFGPELTNADGFTPLLRPKDFSGEAFGYVDGLLGAPHSVANYSRDENGFKYFSDCLGTDDQLHYAYSLEINLDDRGIFTEGAENTRHYDLDFGEGETDFFVFNYAILANYDWPMGDPPFDINDFNISTANMAEAFCMSNTVVNNNLYHDGSEGGGDVSIDVEIWDWQGLDSTEVTIESIETGVLDPVTISTYDTGGTSKSGIFHFVTVPVLPTTVGDLDLTVVATDNSQTFGSSWFMDLLSSDNPLYDVPVYSRWYISVIVMEGTPPKNIIPVEGQINLGIVTTTCTDRPVKDIGVDSSNGKPKIYYASDSTTSHRIYRFLPDYSASDGQVISFGTGGPGGWMDCEEGWTVEIFAWLWAADQCMNCWCAMDETGHMPEYNFWWYGSHDYTYWGRDCFETDDPAHEDYLYVLHDGIEWSQIRLAHFEPDDPPPGPYWPSHSGPFSSTIYNQPGSDGIVGADIVAADALRESTNMVVLEGSDIELWSFTNLTYGGLTISGFTDPLDISVDSDDYIWVLDQPNGNPRLQAFDSTDGTLIATSGEITTPISGTALRIDLDESDNECHLLHTDGVTVFEIDWS